MWRVIEILGSFAIGGVALVELVQGGLHARRGVMRRAAGHVLVGTGCLWWAIDVARGRGLGWPGIGFDLLSYLLVFLGIWLVAAGKQRRAGDAAR